MKRNEVAVIIVTFNGQQWIKKCLDCLIESNFSARIIVVDNMSTDDTHSILSSFKEKIHVIYSGKNYGFGLANNIGIVQALKEDAQYIFLLNQDAYVESDTIESLYNTAINDPSYHLLSPLHFNGAGTQFDYNFSTLLTPELCPGFMSDYKNANSKAIYEAKYVNAAAWFVRRNCFEKIGGFDPIFFMYGEDTNFVQRMHFHGLRIGITPNAKIMHDRENQVSNWHYKKFSDKYFRVLESNFKSTYANINISEPSFFKIQVFELLKLLKLNNLDNRIKQVLLIFSWIKEVRRSRRRNMMNDQLEIIRPADWTT